MFRKYNKLFGSLLCFLIRKNAIFVPNNFCIQFTTMKFKQFILDLLKTKFEGVSEAILGKLAEKLAAKVDTEDAAKAAVEGVTIQRVLESYGDSRATEASQTAVKNYETKHKLKNGEKIDAGGGDHATDGNGESKSGTGGDGIPEWAQALIDSNKKLSDELSSFKQGKIAETRKAQLSEVTKDLPESLRKAYARTPVDGLSDEDFGTLLADITGEVKEVADATARSGAVFGRPKSGAGDDSGKLSKAQEEAIAHREGRPGADQQPF